MRDFLDVFACAFLMVWFVVGVLAIGFIIAYAIQRNRQLRSEQEDEPWRESLRPDDEDEDEPRSGAWR